MKELREFEKGQHWTASRAQLNEMVRRLNALGKNKGDDFIMVNEHERSGLSYRLNVNALLPRIPKPRPWYAAVIDGRDEGMNNFYYHYQDDSSGTNPPIGYYLDEADPWVRYRASPAYNEGALEHSRTRDNNGNYVPTVLMLPDRGRWFWPVPEFGAPNERNVVAISPFRAPPDPQGYTDDPLIAGGFYMGPPPWNGAAYAKVTDATFAWGVGGCYVVGDLCWGSDNAIPNASRLILYNDDKGDVTVNMNTYPIYAVGDEVAVIPSINPATVYAVYSSLILESGDSPVPPDEVKVAYNNVGRTKGLLWVP